MGKVVRISNEQMKEVVDAVRPLSKNSDTAMEMKLCLSLNHEKKAGNCAVRVSTGYEQVEKAFDCEMIEGVTNEELKKDGPYIDLLINTSEFLTVVTKLLEFKDIIEIEEVTNVTYKFSAGVQGSVTINTLNRESTELKPSIQRDPKSLLFSFQVKNDNFLNFYRKGCYAYNEVGNGWMHNANFTLKAKEDPNKENTFLGTLIGLTADGHSVAKSSLSFTDGKVYPFFKEYCNSENKQTLENFIFAIPCENMQLLEQFVCGSESFILTISNKHVFVMIKNAILTFSLASEVYASQKTLISMGEGEFACKVVADKSSLAKSKTILSLLKGVGAIHFSVDGNTLVLSRDNVAKVNVPILGTAGDISKLNILMSTHLFDKAISSLDGGNAVLGFNGPKNPILVISGDLNTKPESFSLVLPLNPTVANS